MKAVSSILTMSALLMVGCCSALRAQGNTNPGPTSSVMAVDKTASGSQITVPVGQLFEVSLDENPSTGYGWAIGSSGEPACKLVRDVFDAPAALGPDGTPIVGRGGTRRLLFQANDLGTGEIRLGYLRPWETGVAPIETFSLAVQVGGATLAQGSVTHLDFAASGTEWTVAVGQLFEVVLEENVTTGFSWAVQSSGTPICDLIDDTSVSGTGLLGKPGYRMLLFRARQAGSGDIALVYRRPWEKGVAPAQTFTMKVNVTAAAAQALSFAQRAPRGDLNADNRVDISDVLLLLRRVLDPSAG